MARRTTGESTSTPPTRNTVAGAAVLAYLERIERNDVEIKELRDDNTAILAEAKAQGYDTKTIRELLKIRKAKPHDLQEFEASLDMYRTAIGMKAEVPLFRAAGLMATDITAREQVIEAFKQIVPQDGEVVITTGGVKVRLWRDEAGTAHAEDVVDEPEPAVGKAQRKPRESPAPKNVPNVDAAGAEQLGRDAAKSNQPIVSNPFPFGDPRRAKWDAGWRKETGSDGMGPDDDED